MTERLTYTYKAKEIGFHALGHLISWLRSPSRPHQIQETFCSLHIIKIAPVAQGQFSKEILQTVVPEGKPLVRPRDSGEPEQTTDIINYSPPLWTHMDLLTLNFYHHDILRMLLSQHF